MSAGRVSVVVAPIVSLALALSGCAGESPGPVPQWSASQSPPIPGPSTRSASASLAPASTTPTGRESSRSTGELTAATLTRVRAARLFFGHQSVGYNVMKGINLLSRKLGVRAPNYVNVQAGESLPVGDLGFLAHAKVGRNGYPLQKLEAFEKLVRGGMGGRLDAALVKLCYVDFNSKTDPAKVFRAYRKVMSRLEKDYPQVTFVYATVPLEVKADQANAIRTRFNQLIRVEYGKTGRLWDIAAAESTDPNGNRVGGKRYESLYADYSNDGAHLNETGAVVVAEPLLSILALSVTP